MMMQQPQLPKQREYPTLYHVPRTISSPLVQILLELDNPGNVWIEEMTFTSIKSPEYLQNVNPMGTSPAFVDTMYNVSMFESGAIVDYVLEQYDRKNSLHPPVPQPISASVATSTGSSTNTKATTTLFRRLSMSGKGMSKQQEEFFAMTQQRAKYLQLKQYILATVYPFVATMFLHSLKPDAEQDATYLQSSKEKWLNVIGPVLSNAIGNCTSSNKNKDASTSDIYFMGSTISAVDFLVSKPLTNIHQMDLLQCFPKLQSLFDHIRSRPTYKLAYEPGRTAQLNYNLATVSSTSNHPIEDDRCSDRAEQQATQVQVQPPKQVSVQPVKGFSFLKNKTKRQQEKKKQQQQQLYDMSDESNSAKATRKKSLTSPTTQQQQGPTKDATINSSDEPADDGVVLESTLIITYEDDDIERAASIEFSR